MDWPRLDTQDALRALVGRSIDHGVAPWYNSAVLNYVSVGL